MRTSEFNRMYFSVNLLTGCIIICILLLLLLSNTVSVFFHSSKKGGTVHKVLAANKNAHSKLGNDRRDEMRIALRQKISQKDYVDKDMKNFHYGKNSATIVNGQMVGGHGAQGGLQIASGPGGANGN